MRWTTYAIAIPLGLFLLAANIEPVAAQQRSDAARPTVSRPIHEERDAMTNTVFSATVDDHNNARITVKAGDFTLEKAVASNGDTTIRLAQGADVVSVAMNQGGYLVERKQKSARFNPQSGKPEDMDAIRAVLLGSQAVRTFRQLTASFEARENNDGEGPLFLSTLVDGAIVQMLDGDSGAAERVGKRITQKRRAGLQPARMRAGEVFTDCVMNYELSLMEAWDLLYECTATTFTLNWFFWWGAETFCEFEFFLRSQQYIYQFFSCFAYPF
ncbi:MAG TPA: hypothetical protein VL243_08910 [Vicinamibacterales bacterium]|nr:hypothetical protein [Vicinamibacterales bacterium]